MGFVKEELNSEEKFLESFVRVERFFKKYKLFFIGLFVFSVVTIALFYNALKPEKELPIFNPADVN